MHMHRALRLAGGARGVEPERHVVAGGRRGVILRLVGADDILEQPVAVRIVAGDDDVLEVGAFLDQLLEFRKQRLRHHQAFRPAVGQHEAVVVLGQQRVDRHRDDAGLEAAEKRGRPVDGVEQAPSARAPRAGGRGRAARRRSAPPGRRAGRRSACRARRYRPACWRGRRRDWLAGRRRRSCSRVGLRPPRHPRLGSPRALPPSALCFLPGRSVLCRGKE